MERDEKSVVTKAAITTNWFERRIALICENAAHEKLKLQHDHGEYLKGNFDDICHIVLKTVIMEAINNIGYKKYARVAKTKMVDMPLEEWRKHRNETISVPFHVMLKSGAENKRLKIRATLGTKK